MRTLWYYQNKKVSKKYLVELFGKQSVDKMLKDAKETYMYDPYIQCSFANGVRIEFVL